MVEKAFAKLDKNGNGEIELDDLQGVYNASKHPDVIQGKKSQEEILQEFLRTFESYSYYRVNNFVQRISSLIFNPREKLIMLLHVKNLKIIILSSVLLLISINTLLL